ncbi:hypothetical protein MKS88_001416 [Plasmodium brasilianum]|uniref:25S rRNA (uridine-N(3))-methyltransferase BMT5-like domain-containing protein n=3 Tax=Plasmodium (Plasmodium) TaxID=418103 RepID=A0A1D3JLS7_PLAMA|nr:conserved protein, unknown function [Plasmodium malariae]KAI4840059.1 hypothetical protein MKS88_001416 [Plasmodium brasilianum]SBT87423.1 conserved protein, unknown function [Plasmodium malariae]
MVKKYSEWLSRDYDKLRKKLKEEKREELIPPSCSSYERYLYNCVKNNDYKDLIIADVIYENKKKVLCIGEGNLSFSTLLQRNLQQCKVVATSMEDPIKLETNYGKNFKKNLKILESFGGIYLPNINVETVDKHFLKNTFDIIVFNFPFVLVTDEFIQTKWGYKMGKDINKDINKDMYKDINKDINKDMYKDMHKDMHSKMDSNNYIKYYKKAEYYLLDKMFYYLFKNSSILLKDKGFLHLRVNDKYLTCRFLNEHSLSFIQRVNFYNSYNIYKSLKYIPSMYNSSFSNDNNNTKKKKNIVFTSNGKIFKSFSMKHTSTLVFQKN